MTNPEIAAYYGDMVFKVEHAGVTYAWVEKGSRACLIADETRMVWWGDPCDPKSLRELDAPLEVLLGLSVLRTSLTDPEP